MKRNRLKIIGGVFIALVLILTGFAVYYVNDYYRSDETVDEYLQGTENGVDCFLVEMPCNLAILGMNKADEIMESYEYDHWYLSGHSLGGAMAANYAAENYQELEGLVLMAFRKVMGKQP